MSAPDNGAPCSRSRWTRLPRWFRRVLMIWATGMLTLMLAGYALYIFRGQWTPEHLADLFRLPLLGGL